MHLQRLKALCSAAVVLVILVQLYNVQKPSTPLLHKYLPSKNSMSTQYNAFLFNPPEMLHNNMQQQPSTKQHPDSKDSCSPHRSVSYVKIHKTGSGALHNRFSQLALHYNLTTAFLISGFTSYGGVFPEPARYMNIMNQAPLKNYRHYNVFVDHARFDRAMQRAFMANYVRFVTQIRNPFSQAESAFHHFKRDRKYKLEKEPSPLTTLLTSTRKDITSLGGQCCNQGQFSFTCNFQAFTLGYRNVRSNNMTHFKAFLQQLDSELFFVSLLEYRDESMVLLRRKMCWHIRDVLTIHSHKTKRVSRQQQVSHNASTELATEQATEQATAKRLHRQLSALDYALYEHFQKKLLSMMNDQGADFKEEVLLYRELNARFDELCCRMCEEFSALKNKSIASIRRLLHEGGENIPATAFYPAFRLNYVDCLLQKSPKEHYVKAVLKVKQQYPEACSSSSKPHRPQELAAKYKLDKLDCDLNNHVYPGYHIDKFKEEILNKDACLGNYYHG